MDIQITGRHVPVTDRFRDHAQEKLDKIELLANRDPRLDIVVSKHGSANGVGTMTVEITCRVKGPVIRAEATSDDKYAAFDVAADVDAAGAGEHHDDDGRVAWGRGGDDLDALGRTEASTG